MSAVGEVGLLSLSNHFVQGAKVDVDHALLSSESTTSSRSPLRYITPSSESDGSIIDTREVG